MKKILKVFLAICGVLMVKLLLTLFINSIIIINYNNERYNDSLLNPLYIFNISEPYIVYYNHGNLLYKNGFYNEALEKYNKALTKKIPKKRVCSVRINLSLSLIANIKSSEKEKAINILREAKSNLYNNNCAHENDDKGYSVEAEKLEKEIDKLIKEINEKPSSSEQKKENEQNKEEKKVPSKEVEEKIKNSNSTTTANRKEELENLSEIENEYYSGKKW